MIFTHNSKIIGLPFCHDILSGWVYYRGHTLFFFGRSGGQLNFLVTKWSCQLIFLVHGHVYIYTFMHIILYLYYRNTRVYVYKVKYLIFRQLENVYFVFCSKYFHFWFIFVCSIDITEIMPTFVSAIRKELQRVLKHRSKW